jgi:predicted anti-sigma-YlaC factor YlaD
VTASRLLLAPAPDRVLRALACALLLAVGVTGCSVRGVALDSVAAALSASGDLFAADDDPELVRAATPFALKTLEALIAERPRNVNLLLAAVSGFTSYAYAFPDTDALLLEADDPERAREEKARALRLYLRARDYGLRGLELRVPGSAAALRSTPEDAVQRLGRADVPLMYWTAAAWGAAIAAAGDPVLLADFPAVRALLRRALELDPTFGDGALHETLISVEAVPALIGGSEERARHHFEHALALSGGRRAGPYVALATGVSVGNQNRAEFVSLLEQALAVAVDAEPSQRLANIITQRRARQLLARADWLFFAEGLEDELQDEEDVIP